MGKLNRYEIWKLVTKEMPELNCFGIDGHKGYGYVKREYLVKIAHKLGLTRVV